MLLCMLCCLLTVSTYTVKTIGNFLVRHGAWGFWWESFLIFPFIYLQVYLRSNLHIGLFDLVNPLISADRKYSIHHTQTSLFGNCAGGSQGVQFLDRSNKDQVRAIRLRCVGQLAPQHLMLKPVNWQIYLGPRESLWEDLWGPVDVVRGEILDAADDVMG